MSWVIHAGHGVCQALPGWLGCARHVSASAMLKLVARLRVGDSSRLLQQMRPPCKRDRDVPAALAPTGVSVSHPEARLDGHAPGRVSREKLTTRRQGLP